jgi:hypothetical protein
MAPHSTTETAAHSTTEAAAHSTTEAAAHSTTEAAAHSAVKTTTTATLSYSRYYQKATYQEDLRKSSHDTYLQSQSNAAPGG